jgi:DNA-binding CsgD family transcriptional regulator
MGDLSFLKEWLCTHAGGGENRYRELQREFELFFTHVFDSSSDGISILDLELTILAVNTTMERWYAHELPIAGRKCYEVYHGRSTPCRRCPTREAMESGAPRMGRVPYEAAEAVRGSQELSVFPLFDDQRRMLGVIEYVRDVTRRKEEDHAVESLKRRLQLKDRTLYEQEVALRVLLRQGEREAERITLSIRDNLEALVKPLLERLKARTADRESRELLLLLERRLREIASPFLQALPLRQRGLTPRETEVAALIKEGKTSKEIALLLGVSVKAVEFHRLNLREKLGIAGSGRSLHTQLHRLS